MLDVCLLGTGGMMPFHYRWLSSMLLRYNGRMILVDCGEGTQIPFRQAGWGFIHLDAILLTHYHADHVAGLPGLLLSLQNAGRTEPLLLVGPKGIEAVVRSLMVIAPNISFPIRYVTVDNERFTLQIGDVHVKALFLDHNIQCMAFQFEIPRMGKFDPEKARSNAVPMKFWSALQKGQTVMEEGREYTSDMILGSPRKGIKVCYCTDTRPVSGLVEFAKGSNLLICEGMYAQNEYLKKAQDKKHMLFSEAATIAKKAGVDELWLTHFSPCLTTPWQFVDEARRIFPNTIAGKDLMKKSLLFEEA